MRSGIRNWGLGIRNLELEINRFQTPNPEFRPLLFIISRKPSEARQNAFTLLELLVALTISAMVIFGVVAAFGSWVRTQEQADWAIEKTRRQEYTLSRLREVLSLSYVPFVPGRENLAVFDGRDLERPSEPFDALTFASLGHKIQRIDAKESELIEMTVFTVPDETLEDGDKCRILKLREGGVINDDYERLEVEGGMVYELARRVSRFQIFYLSPEAELKQEWKLAENEFKLPCAVVIWFGMGCGDAEEDWCLLIPLYLTNNEGCEFEEESLRQVCEIRR